MRITYIALFRFRPFLVNEVELLEMDITGDVQNIIGSNGSGKSSLLRELNPYPATRTDFGENGYKRMRLTHEGSEYELFSDFSSPSAPHAFRKDGVEMNTSGTTPVQDELIESELGYTRYVHTICYGEYKLSAMQIGQRKTFLLTIHPWQMKLIFDKHKNSVTKLRSYRDNLSMLQERRAQLATQMIETGVCDALRTENDQLSHQLGQIVQAIGQLDNQKQTILQRLTDYPAQNPIRTRETYRSAQRRYPGFYRIPRDIPMTLCRQNTLNTLSIITTKHDTAVDRMRHLTQEIDKYEHHLRQNDAQGAIDIIEGTIAALQADIVELTKHPTKDPFDRFVLDAIPQHIDHLTDLVGVFIGYQGRIPAMRDVHRLEHKLDHNDRQRAIVAREVDNLAIQLATLEATLRSNLIQAIPLGCHDCILFQTYSTTISRMQTDYDHVNEILRRTQRRHHQLDRLVEARRIKLAHDHVIVPQLQRLSSYFNDYPFLLRPLQEIDLLMTLRTNPSLILVRLEQHYHDSQAYYVLHKKQEALDRHILDYEQLKTPSAFSGQFLEMMVREKHQELVELRTYHQQLIIEQGQQQSFLTLVTAYETELQHLNNERQSLQQQASYATLVFERDLCDRYHAMLEQSKRKTVSRLTEIDHTLREQEALSARYHQEVMTNISLITQQERQYSAIEKALSPTIGIPYRYMVQFVNDLIDDANVFLAEVFSYPFEFIPITDRDTFDYKFRMRVGDVVIPDIARGSEAQKEMADLALTLALIIQLRQTNYALYLDECDKAFDAYHKQRLLQFLKSIVDDQLISQLFLINHSSVIYSGLQNANTLVLNQNNIILPEVFNTHVLLQKY